MFKMEVSGIEETRRWLNKIDAEVGKALTKELRAVGNELRDDARKRIPGTAPLSGWQGVGRAEPSRMPYWESSSQAKKEIKTIVGRGSRQRGTYREGAVIRVASNTPWGAVFDKAGGGGTTFADNLNRKHGPKRRALLGAYDENKDKLVDKAEDAILRAVDKVIDRGP